MIKPHKKQEESWAVQEQRGPCPPCAPRAVPEDGAVAVILDGVIFLIGLDGLGEPKVPNLHPVLTLHQDIPGCQVTVHVLTGAQVVHALREEKRNLLFPFLLFLQYFNPFFFAA